MRLARHYQVVVLLLASITFLTGVLSPPYLMDDVDAVQAQIARNMLASGDFVTARLDGVAYLEKAPLKYWLIALSYRIFGIHDWAARLVIALAAILTCWVTSRFAAWAMGPETGLYSGLFLSTCIGLFLFTRIMIPDPLLMLFIALSMYCFLRALDPEERHSRWWARGFWASMALGLLTKGLISAVFPVAAAFLFLLFKRELISRRVWHRLLPIQGPLIFLLIGAPWHVLATLANPPHFDWTMHSESGSYHGFFWFYFLNEHVFRFLNIRYPRDYNTVSRPLFWLFHLIWFFPWSVYLLRLRKLNLRGDDRGSRAKLLAVCWAAFILFFFSLSTTQEYYSLSAYPAFALLIGSAMAAPGFSFDKGARVAASIAAVAGLAISVLLWNVRNLDTPGDIAKALSNNPDLYTLSLGHMADLTFQAFAYLKFPLAVALCATLIGAIGGWIFRGQKAVVALVLMMLVFFQAARIALKVFDPYLGSRPLAEALLHSPGGKVIVDDQYYDFSSVFFYANVRDALLLNGRTTNLEYGSYAPGAPNVFIKDPDLLRLWSASDRYYLIADGKQIPRLARLVGRDALHQVAEAGNKYLFVNR